VTHKKKDASAKTAQKRRAADVHAQIDALVANDKTAGTADKNDGAHEAAPDISPRAFVHKRMQELRRSRARKT